MSLRPCWLGLSVGPSRHAASEESKQKEPVIREYADSTGLQCFVKHNERGVGT